MKVHKFESTMGWNKEVDRSYTPTILYLHGLDGKVYPEHISIFEKIGAQYIAISTNYRFGQIWENLKGLEFDGVIGTSLGGYLAYYLSNLHKKPSLLFVPCFDDEMFNIQQIPKEVQDLPVFANQIAVIGKEDKDVDYKKQIKRIKDIEIIQEDMDHDVPFDIFENQCKYFLQRII